MIAIPADGPSFPIYISGKFKWTSFFYKKWLLKNVAVIYFAYVWANWQLYFITSWILPVMINEPWDESYFLSLFYCYVLLVLLLFMLFYTILFSLTKLVTADSIYIILPPYALYANPIITPFGGTPWNNLD